MTSTPDAPVPGSNEDLEVLENESRDEIEAPEEKPLEGILPVPEPTDPIGSAFENDGHAGSSQAPPTLRRVSPRRIGSRGNAMPAGAVSVTAGHLRVADVPCPKILESTHVLADH